MADYYSILGLTKTATDIEIKTAFRRLAKIYHPDKNPDPKAKVLFESILKAYNVLSNVNSKRRYDTNINYSTSTQNTRPNGPGHRSQKDYSFTEEDAKRRDYYKKQYQAKKHTVNTEAKKNSYNDYKYILFATPIAVGLLMLIVSLFNTEPSVEVTTKKTKNITKNIEPTTTLINGDKPYTGFFGNIKLFETDYYLKINNSSNYDAVIAVFDKKTNAYLQHSYLQASYSIEFLKLPETGVYWKCVLGKNWNKNKAFLNATVFAGFDSIVQYQNWQTSPVQFSKNAVDDIYILHVIHIDSKNKQYISDAKTFFEK